MNQGMMNTVVSAIVGGLVGAGVVFFVGGSKVDFNNLELENLQVANLTITTQATLLNEQGTPELFIRDGSILAEKVILGNKLIGQQLQGHAIVGNRVFVTPDSLVHTPMEDWKFYAEIGASRDAGGEIVVRSVAGPASVGRTTTNGALLRAGFTPEGGAQLLAIQNIDRSPMQISFDLSEQQRRLLNAGAASAGMMTPPVADAFSSEAMAPIHHHQGGATLAAPDPNALR
jgi:hypothetical protein